MKLSQRVGRIQPSPTLAITSRAKALRAAGRDIIVLAAGEPDFDTPDHIKQAGIDAILQGDTKYTAVDGTPVLKQAIIDKLHRDNGLDYTQDQILVSVGGKHSFFNLAQAMLNSGDEVVIPAPYWVSYPDIVQLADAQAVFIHAGIDQGFKITPEQLDAAITTNTRLVVINSPSNPTGSVYSRGELEALGNVLHKHPQVIIATDDMYEHILWADEPFCNILMACPDLYDRSIVLNGVSKAYSMTGWRIGYAAGPKELIGAMKKIQSQCTSNPASMAQAAAVTALNGDQSCMGPMLAAFRERHNRVVARLNNIPGFHCLPSLGTFYAFPLVRDAISRQPNINNDVELAEYILNKIEVALVPGSAFGAESHLRLSYATSMEQLNTALDRMETLFAT